MIEVSTVVSLLGAPDTGVSPSRLASSIEVALVALLSDALRRGAGVWLKVHCFLCSVQYSQDPPSRGWQRVFLDLQTSHGRKRFLRIML